MSKFINNALSVNIADPDDARRRKLLNILLLGVGGLTFFTFIASVIFTISGSDAQTIGPIWAPVLGMLVGVGFFYWINRNPAWPGWISSSLFLSFLLVAFFFVDEPLELAGGRSLFIFTIPIIMSSILLRPAASFIFAILTSVEITYLALTVNLVPNVYAMVGFFLLALISWLSSRSLEQALKELRHINTNLDRLVEQKTQELAKALSRELVLAGRNRAILESIADGVVVFDTHGEATQANPALAELLNIPSEQIVGATIQQITAMEPLDVKSRGHLVKLLTSPGSHQASYRINWGKKTLSVNAAQVQDSAGEMVGTVAVFRDFTREAELERMKDSFLATVSHELRTPLNAILGYAEMLKEAIYGPVNEKQAGVSDRIMTNSRRLLSLVNDLLDQARMEAGKLSIHMGPLKPAELLDSVHEVMDKIASDKELKLTSYLDPVLPALINGDAQRLQQIIVNLVNNAVKFTDTGTVHMSLTQADPLHWRIEVTDTGRGIPENELPRIFDAFRQVESTATREHGGFGLGLSIVKQLAGLMNGEVSVASEVGKGSRFTVTLPLTEP
jgi:PAS domain S-box-containing protein